MTQDISSAPATPLPYRAPGYVLRLPAESPDTQSPTDPPAAKQRPADNHREARTLEGRFVRWLHSLAPATRRASSRPAPPLAGASIRAR